MTEEKNPMRDVAVDKLVVNIGTGGEEPRNQSAKKLLELLTGRKPSPAAAKKRNPAFKIAKGHQIGTFVTIRGAGIKPLAQRLFNAVDNRIKPTAIADNSVSFGVREYIDISGIKYDPKIGMLGMNVNLSFKRKGLRVRLRKRKNSTIPESHRAVDRQHIQEYLKKEYGVELAE
jgi:large subunit ribosomal protein L5